MEIIHHHAVGKDIEDTHLLAGGFKRNSCIGPVALHLVDIASPESSLGTAGLCPKWRRLHLRPYLPRVIASRPGEKATSC